MEDNTMYIYDDKVAETEMSPKEKTLEWIDLCISGVQ
ncbi:hypothetical protein LCGC14_3004150, partial [marine sediment metagenome]